MPQVLQGALDPQCVQATVAVKKRGAEKIFSSLCTANASRVCTAQEE